jgi:hypothetical protein
MGVDVASNGDIIQRWNSHDYIIHFCSWSPIRIDARCEENRLDRLLTLAAVILFFALMAIVILYAWLMLPAMMKHI